MWETMFEVYGTIYGKVLAVIVLNILIYLILRWLLDKKNFPPGPLGLPLFGYLPFMGKEPHLTLHKLTGRYGSVFGFYLGSQYVVVLGDYRSMKEAFKKPELLGRPRNSPLKFGEKKKSLSIVNGEEWRQQRRFILHQLKDLGFGTSQMEENIKDEVSHFLLELEKTAGKAFVYENLLSSSVSNVITYLVFGRRFDYDDCRRQFLDKKFASILSFFGQTAVHSFMPWLTPILVRFGLMNYSQVRQDIREVYQFVDTEISEHRKTLDSNYVRDFIDGFLLQMEKQDSNCCSSFTMEMLHGNIQSLIGAGSEPVTGTIEWCLTIFATFIHVQRRIQEEIDDIMGRERFPNLCDCNKMPYTQSVIMEVQRLWPASPLNLLRCTDNDITINGYKIPKNAAVLANLWGIHRDPSCWDNADDFNAERFLNENQTQIIKSEGLVPFSFGKRSCPGEALARAEVFLYTTAILQRYNVSFPDGFKHNLEGTPGVTLKPKACALHFTKRV